MLPKLPSHIPRPEPKRLPDRKRMTAIIGFIYLDGVLMMADTEESLGGDAKSECDKLCRFTFRCGTAGVGTILTGGAGDSHLIDCANQELRQLLASRWIDTETDILPALNRFAGDFFEELMRGYQGLDYRLVPSFEMLIAVNVRPNTYLFIWKGNRVVPASTHASIGVGIAQTHPILRDVQFSGTCETMLFHGIRMMFQAKRAVVGVGGKTEAIALEGDGTTRFFGLEATRKIEDLVIGFEEFINKAIYMAVSNVSQGVMELDENVQKFLAEVPGIFHQYREAYRQILTPPSASQTSKGQP